jgi:hypothetical protein
VAVKDREELLGEVPPAEGKQPCAASAGKDQSVYDESSSMIVENMASPPLYRLFHQRVSAEQTKGHRSIQHCRSPIRGTRQTGTNQGLDGSGKPSDIPGHREDFQKDRHYLPGDCSPVTNA